MRKSLFLALLFLSALCAAGCAQRHYFGLHGPSVRRFPELHAGIKEDRTCLQCHDPQGDPSGPPTSHPRFVGCLKCHDDAI